MIEFNEEIYLILFRLSQYAEVLPLFYQHKSHANNLVEGCKGLSSLQNVLVNIQKLTITCSWDSLQKLQERYVFSMDVMKNILQNLQKPLHNLDVFQKKLDCLQTLEEMQGLPLSSWTEDVFGRFGGNMTSLTDTEEAMERQIMKLLPRTEKNILYRPSECQTDVALDF